MATKKARKAHMDKMVKSSGKPKAKTMMADHKAMMKRKKK